MSSTSEVDLSESMQPQLRMLLIAMIVVPTVIVFIRAWSRALLPTTAASKIPTKFWWDDWTAFLAAAINIAVCGLGLRLIDLGLGLHIQAIPTENIEKFLKLLWIIYYVFDTGTAVGKMSALFFYARIFSVNNSKFKYALWVVHAMTAAWLVGILLSVTFMCDPVPRAWETSLPGHCLNTGKLWIGSGVTSLLIDIIILVMPLPMLWNLQMKVTRRILITGVFICGYLVVVVSIGRLVTIVQAGTELNLDPTYKISTPVLWLGSEIAISVICVSLPSVFFLVQRLHRQGFASLFSIHTQTTRSTQVKTNPFRDGDDEILMSRTGNYPFQSRTKVTAEFGGVSDGNDSTSMNNGIHVMRYVEVV